MWEVMIMKNVISQIGAEPSLVFMVLFRNRTFYSCTNFVILDVPYFINTTEQFCLMASLKLSHLSALPQIEQIFPYEPVKWENNRNRWKLDDDYRVIMKSYLKKINMNYYETTNTS